MAKDEINDFKNRIIPRMRRLILNSRFNDRLTNQLLQSLDKYYNEFIENDYKLNYPGNEEVNKYTTENMAFKFAKILDDL